MTKLSQILQVYLYVHLERATKVAETKHLLLNVVQAATLYVSQKHVSHVLNILSSMNGNLRKKRMRLKFKLDKLLIIQSLSQHPALPR